MRNPAAGAGAGASKTTPCCSKVGIKKGPWTAEEDEILSSYIKREGEGAWRTLPKRAGLLRCGKSCRLRWMNYLRPHLNRSPISPDEEDLILRLHRLLGNRWSLIAGRIPGRTDNEIKNYWNTHLSKKLISQGLDPRTHKPLEIYNPNPMNLTNNQQYSVEPNPNPNSATASMPSPPPAVILGQQEKAKAKASDGMMMMEDSNNEDMYFSSFLDSLIMSDEQLVSNDDNNQQVFFQDMMIMMQPMGTHEPNQGLIYGSENHEAPLMASGGFSRSHRDLDNRNLDPEEMGRK